MYPFNASIWWAEAGGFLSSKTVWSMEQVPEQAGLHRKPLFWKTNKQKCYWFIICMCVCAACVCLVPIETWRKQIPWDWSYRCCEPLCGRWKPQLGPLQEQRCLNYWTFSQPLLCISDQFSLCKNLSVTSSLVYAVPLLCFNIWIPYFLFHP